MKTERSKLGSEGEDYAAQYLKNKGWKIIDRNFRIHADELDIVASEPDGTLVFVEVKTMHGYHPEGIGPEQQMTAKKMERFARAASLYAGRDRNAIDDENGWRLDVIALTKIGNDFIIKHYENVGWGMGRI